MQPRQDGQHQEKLSKEQLIEILNLLESGQLNLDQITPEQQQALFNELYEPPEVGQILSNEGFVQFQQAYPNNGEFGAQHSNQPGVQLFASAANHQNPEQENGANSKAAQEMWQMRQQNYQEIKAQLQQKGIDCEALEYAGVDLNELGRFSDEDLQQLIQLQNNQIEVEQLQGALGVEGGLMLGNQMFELETLVKMNPQLSIEEIQQLLEENQNNVQPGQMIAIDPAALQLAYFNPAIANQHNAQPIFAQEQMMQQHMGTQKQELEILTGSSSMGSDELKEQERQRDQYFEQQLRLFYKSMIERLSPATIDKISKKAKQFCEQLNKVQGDILASKKKADGDNTDQEPGEMMDSDSSCRNALYGPNSILNPDPFINEVLTNLHMHSDLKKQFMRFLPESDEEDVQELEQKVQMLRAQMNLQNDVLPMGFELDRSHDESVAMQNLKKSTYENLFALLEEYQKVKEQSYVTRSNTKLKECKEKMQTYGSQIMEIAENYQKQVKDDLENQIKSNKFKPGTVNFVEMLEKAMSVMLSIIPQDIIDNYNLDMAIAQNEKKDKDYKKFLKPVDSSSEDISDEEGSQDEEEEQEEESVEEEEDQEEQEDEDNEEEQIEVAEFESKQEERGIQRLKSVMNELSMHYPAFKDLNRIEVKTFENLHKALKTDANWVDFTKIFMLYLEGITSLQDMFMLFGERFGNKIKEDLRDEVEHLLPTRDHNRRLMSDILRPWNDLENQHFEKIYDSSYYKLPEKFPLPICTEKLNPSHGAFYQQFLNERYLSLSMGSENFKFKIRNANEDLMFKNEDEMYKLDTQIEMFQKCLNIVNDQILVFDELAKIGKTQSYEFPRKKFKHLMNFWEKRYKDAILHILYKPFKRDFLIHLREGLGGKLRELHNTRLDQLPVFEDVYRKNFVKSLDHRSFQYKDFTKKFLQKQTHLTEIKQVASQNQCGVRRHLNELKGGFQEGSPFYHSFGQFVQPEDLINFDVQTDDFPINMNYPDFEKIASNYTEKLPHLRLVFKDDQVCNIAIKILCLHIRFSSLHHNNDRARLIENLRHIVEQFMGVNDFTGLTASCGFGKIEGLSQSQVDILMNQDSHLYYLSRNDNTPLKIQISKPEQEVPITPNPISSQPRVTISEPKLQSDAESSVVQTPTKPRAVEINSDFKKLQVTRQQQVDLSTCEFLPHITTDCNYNLFYAPQNIYMFIKYFYGIYERFLKAKDLIKEKLQQDLAEITLMDKKNAGICDSTTGEIINHKLEELFDERYEYLLKGIFLNTTMSAGLVNTSGIPGGSAVIDHSKYEDFARVLLGKNAFLLFQIDKIISHAIKQLLQMHSDQVSQKSIKLFKQFQDQANFTDTVYLATYADSLVEHFSLKDNLNSAKSFKLKADECKHSQSLKELHNIPDTIEQVAAKQEAGVQANTTHQNQNFQAFRLLFSKKSKIMSIHFLNLNPFQLQTSSFRKTLNDNFEVLRDAASKPIATSATSCTHACNKSFNRVGDHSQPPVFLKRNLKLMEKHRSRENIAQQGQTQNGLSIEVIPQLNQLSFGPEKQSEDTFVMQRKTGLISGEQLKNFIRDDLKKQIKQQEIKYKRIKTIQ